MRIEYIRLENFRSIKDEITVRLSPNKTVIVGQNNVGKTNIITALEILFGERYPTYYPLEEKDFFDPEKPLEIEVKISEIDKNLDYPRIKWKAQNESTDKRKITYNNGELILKFVANFNNSKTLKCFVENTPPHTTDEIIRSLTDEFLKSLLSFVFVPADRTIRADLKTGEYAWYGKLLRMILESQSETEKYKDLVKKLEEIEALIREILKSENVLKMGQLLTFIEDLRFSLTKSQKPKDLLKYIEILIEDTSENYLEIARLGHGTQSAILIGLLEMYLNTLSTSRNSILRVFAIDEPENFLHPQGKRLINSLLEKIAENENTQVIYTTHSSELITNFEEDKFTLKDVVYVYKEDGLTKIRQFTEEESVELFKIQEELDVEKGEIFFASGVILVEGETEKHSLPLIYKYHSWSKEDLPERCKEKYEKNPSDFFDLDLQNISVINVGGKDNVLKYFKFAVKILGKGNVAVILDKDSDFNNNFKRKLKNLIKEIFNEESENFERYGIFILSKGEFEHYYNLDTIKNFLIRKIILDIENGPNIGRIPDETRRKEVIENLKSQKIQQLEQNIEECIRNTSKLSKGYEYLFEKYMKGWTKPAIAFKLTKFLLKNDGFYDEIFEILKRVRQYLRTNHKLRPLG